jgi:demethylmenaquinone methyltransferase/2-methoxy-6-polyprenyl-1,4-benzoquinol methylase
VAGSRRLPKALVQSWAPVLARRGCIGYGPVMSEQSEQPATASFGFREVPAEARQGLVNSVFARVAERYDLMNDLMSGGLHRLWKDDLVNWLAPSRSAPAYEHIDVAGGTGDIALRVMRACGAKARSIICDISPEMLAVGRRRLAETDVADRIAFTAGNAEALPFPDRRFDAYTIAFGIRNVTHIDRALAEAYRVLKPGGRFLCLEFSEVQVPILDALYDLHSFEIIPRLGRLAAGDEDSYRYLVESIRKFPKQEAFAGMLRAAGFARVQYRNLSGGIAALHSAWRI